VERGFDILEGRLEEPNQGSNYDFYEKPDDVRLSEELFIKYRDARRTWDTQAQEDIDFRNGAQWSPADLKVLKARRHAPIVVNVIHPAVEQAKAQITANKPRFSAAGREASDNKTAAVIADLFEWIWNISNGNSELKPIVDDYLTCGAGYMMAYSDPHADYGKGEVFIKSLSPFDVFIDPTSTDIFCRDAAHIIVSKLLTKEQIQRSYPGILSMLAQAQQDMAENMPQSLRVGLEGQGISFSNQIVVPRYRIIDRYSFTKRVTYRVFEPQSSFEKIVPQAEIEKYLASPAIIRASQQDQQIILRDDDLQQAMQMYQQLAASHGIFHLVTDQTTGQPTPVPGPESGQPGEVPGSTTQLILTTVGDLMKQRLIQINECLEDDILRVFSIGGLLIYKDFMGVDSYPIIPFFNRHQRSPYPTGDVRTVRGLQEYINKVKSLIVAHAANSTSPKLIVNRGSVNIKDIDEKWKSAGAEVIEVDFELGVPTQMAPTPLAGELYKNEADAKADIQNVLGIYNSGDPGNAQQSYRGTVAVDEFGQRRIKSKLDDIEAGLNQLGRVVVQLIQQTYTEYKVIRLLRPNNVSKQSAINDTVYPDNTGAVAGTKINDVTIGKYDVVVISGSTLPTNRWARLEYYTQLYKEGIIDAVEVLKQTEVADLEGVMERMDQVKQLQAALQQAQEQIKGLSGDLQTAQRESVQDRKRVEVEKFKTKLYSHEKDSEMKTQLYKERLNDELHNSQFALNLGAKMQQQQAANAEGE
jgi:hypothetical protein